MHELMIIGAGPAGLAASVYAARKQLKVLLVSGDIGGQMNQTLGIENYLGYQFIEAPELIDKFQTQIEKFPIDQQIGYKINELTRIDGGFEAIAESGDKYRAKAVIFAAGKRPRKLNVPGEAELTGRGVTYCVICDGPVFAGQRVVVVGGGNSALEGALDMVKIAEHVALVSLAPLTGDQILVDQLRGAENLDIFTEYQMEKIEGQNLVEGVLIKNIKSGEERQLKVGGVFIEIGLTPNSEPVKELVKLNQFGEIIITPTCETSVPGFFAAGDVSNVPEKQIIVAAGEGAKAVLQAHRYLQRLGT